MSELLIYGEIGWDCVAADVVRELQAIDGEVTVRINSPGGDVYDGLTIMNALRSHDGRVTAVVEGLAASAASFIAVGGAERVIMRPTAELMIHDAMSFVGGNAEEMLSAITDLERISDNLAAIYAEKAGGEPADWRTRMKAESWYSANEAVDAGLADAVEDGRAVENRSGRRVVMAKFRYQGRRDAPEPAVQSPTGHDREEHHMSALSNLAREIGLDEDKISAALASLVVNEEMTITNVTDITYPEVEIVPTGQVTVSPEGDLPDGVAFELSDSPEEWEVEVDESTGALTITAPSGVEPGDEAEFMVGVSGGDEPVAVVVTVMVKAASEEGSEETESNQESPSVPADDRIVLDVDTYNELKRAAELGAEAYAKTQAVEREAEVDQWIADGRINVATRAKAIALMDKDPDTARGLYGANPKNTIPVREIGHGLNPDAEGVDKSEKNAELRDRASRSNVFPKPKV